MSTNIQRSPTMTPDGSPVPEKELDELCKTYNIPPIIGRMCFCLIKGQLYVKLPMLLHKGHERGIQRVLIEREENPQAKEYRSTVSIYPKVDKEVLKLILQFPASLHKEMWEFYSAPTVGIGRASLENVSNQSMHKFLPEMGDKRGLARGLRTFAGIGQSSYEELPEAVLSGEELSDPQGIQIERVTKSRDPATVIEAGTIPAKAVEVPAATDQEASMIKDLEKRGVIKEPAQEARPAAPTAADPAPSTSAPAATDVIPEKCVCGHAWKEHFGQRAKVACLECFKARPKVFLCNITPDQLNDYKRLKPLPTVK